MLGFLKHLLCSAIPEASYSQSGEDRIVKFVLDTLGIKAPYYLDIGAHHPVHLSNTYLFYGKGGTGVLIEPNPRWHSIIKKKRINDVFLNVGIARNSIAGAQFYVMTSDTLCTFSKNEAERMVAECGQAIQKVATVDIVTPTEVVGKYFSTGLNYVSLDVEGLELEILEAFPLTQCRPEVFCVETLTYALDGAGKKNVAVIDYMVGQGYMVYADTYINTIFVDRNRWVNRG